MKTNALRRITHRTKTTTWRSAIKGPETRSQGCQTEKFLTRQAKVVLLGCGRVSTASNAGQVGNGPPQHPGWVAGRLHAWQMPLAGTRTVVDDGVDPGSRALHLYLLYLRFECGSVSSSVRRSEETREALDGR